LLIRLNFGNIYSRYTTPILRDIPTDSWRYRRVIGKGNDVTGVAVRGR